VQALFAIVAATILAAVTYACIYGVEVLLKRLRVEDPWIDALKDLKGVGFFVVLLAYLALEMLHLKAVHFDEKHRR